jgi:hypothetical protein
MRVADRGDSLFRGKRGVEMHCASASDKKDMLHALIGDKLEHVIGKFHQYLS